MTKLSNPHPARTQLQMSPSGQPEYPYPYNAWITRVFSLTEFTEAFAKHMQQQKTRVPESIWQEECNVNHALLNEMAKLYELPSETASQLWTSFTESNEHPDHQAKPHAIEHKPVESRPVESRPVESRPVEGQPIQNEPIEHTLVANEPVETIPTKAPLTSRDKVAPIRAKIENEEEASPLPSHAEAHTQQTQLPPHRRQQTQPGGILDTNLNPIQQPPRTKKQTIESGIKGPFTAQRDQQARAHPIKKKRFRSVLVLLVLFILAVNAIVVASLFFSEGIPALEKVRSILVSQGASSNDAALTSTINTSITAEQSSSKKDTLIDEIAAMALGNQAIESIETETIAPETIDLETINMEAIEVEKTGLVASKPETTQTLPDSRVILSLLRAQAAELNIEPVTDADTALFYLQQLGKTNPGTSEMAKAHLALQKGYRALSKLAKAQGQIVEAQRLQNRAKSHENLSNQR